MDLWSKNAKRIFALFFTQLAISETLKYLRNFLSYFSPSFTQLFCEDVGILVSFALIKIVTSPDKGLCEGVIPNEVLLLFAALPIFLDLFLLNLLFWGRDLHLHKNVY